MKKLVLALTAAAAFAAPALAADMAPRYAKAVAAPIAYAPSWTGCYIGGGGGFGMYNQENTPFVDGPPPTQIFDRADTGGRGYFGTVGAGCDYQFAVGGSSLLVGAFGDYDFASIKGQHAAGFIGVGTATEKLSSAWSVGGRIGWVVMPNFMTYFSGGYTEATFDQQNYAFLGVPTGISTGKQTYKGWFLGAGDEYALSFLPGLFWKTEYRFSEFDYKYNQLPRHRDGLADRLFR